MNLSNSDQTRSTCSLKSKDRDRRQQWEMVLRQGGPNSRISNLNCQEVEVFNLVKKKNKAKTKRVSISTFGSSRSRKRKRIKREKELRRFEEKERNCRLRWIIILMESVGLELGQPHHLLLLGRCLKTRLRT
jgi:hypothetical protein